MERYKENEILTESFIQIPKALFLNEEYCNLSSNAILMYGLLKDRMLLSKKNKWINDAKEIYLIFAQNDMESWLHISHTTCSKAMKELEQHELIERVRRGLGNPDYIFIGKIKPGKEISRSLKIKHQSFKKHTSCIQKLDPNKTKGNDTKPKEDNEKSNITPSSSSLSALDFFSKNGHKPAPFEAETLVELIEKYSHENVMKAMKEATLKNALTVKYITAILRNWETHGGDKNPKQQNSDKQKTVYWTPEKQAKDIAESHRQMEKLGIPVYGPCPAPKEADSTQVKSQKEHKTNGNITPIFNSILKSASANNCNNDSIVEIQLQKLESEIGILQGAVRNTVLHLIRTHGFDQVAEKIKTHPKKAGEDITEFLTNLNNQLEDQRNKKGELIHPLENKAIS
ncbi:replication initiator protein A [uncultured Acidaminococcus sp.]|uniref:replication initiator protein A n=1 Tax=uncultured Acidaminococcus sp. TaxID=352152 RepID=UPI002584D586|nr:replication initiator protein A [uncultured Acidaminococcus sp.]